jgi:AcrR family transcriptional regulator
MSMRQPRTNPEVRRQQILEMATRLIGLQGYHGLTIQELAKECGLTNGGLLYYFGSKEELLVAILEERDRRETAIIAADLEVERPASGGAKYARSTVLQIFRAIIARSVAQPELLRFYAVLSAEALNREHPANIYFLRREATVLEEFTKLLVGHVSNPNGAARQILALIGGLEQQWLRVDMAFDLAAAFDEAIALVLPWAKTILGKSSLFAST